MNQWAVEAGVAVEAADRFLYNDGEQLLNRSV
jgi:hypothetical protein